MRNGPRNATRGCTTKKDHFEKKKKTETAVAKGRTHTNTPSAEGVCITVYDILEKSVGLLGDKKAWTQTQKKKRKTH